MDARHAALPILSCMEYRRFGRTKAIDRQLLRRSFPPLPPPLLPPPPPLSPPLPHIPCISGMRYPIQVAGRDPSDVPRRQPGKPGGDHPSRDRARHQPHRNRAPPVAACRKCSRRRAAHPAPRKNHRSDQGVADGPPEEFVKAFDQSMKYFETGLCGFVILARRETTAGC